VPQDDGRRTTQDHAAVASLLFYSRTFGSFLPEGGKWHLSCPLRLIFAGGGLALLVIPLGNVVLAAVPAEAAGGASGLFGTAQQLGGAIGVAAAGTIFFGWLARGHTFAAAMTRGAPYAIGAFAVCAALSLLLPRTAVADSVLIGDETAEQPDTVLAGG
jgi:hypothetical protein